MLFENAPGVLQYYLVQHLYTLLACSLHFAATSIHDPFTTSCYLNCPREGVLESLLVIVFRNS